MICRNILPSSAGSRGKSSKILARNKGKVQFMNPVGKMYAEFLMLMQVVHILTTVL
jgi:hypothetical protein